MTDYQQFLAHHTPTLLAAVIQGKLSNEDKIVTKDVAAAAVDCAKELWHALLSEGAAMIPTPQRTGMDITTQMAQAFTAQNTLISEEAILAAHADGAKAAAAAVASGGTFFLMDEMSFNKIQNAYAMGWNSQGAQLRAVTTPLT